MNLLSLAVKTEKMGKMEQLVPKVLQVCEVHLVVMVLMVLTVLKGNREIEESLVLRDSMDIVSLGRQQITKSGWTLIYNHVQEATTEKTELLVQEVVKVCKVYPVLQELTVRMVLLVRKVPVVNLVLKVLPVPLVRSNSLKVVLLRL